MRDYFMNPLSMKGFSTSMKGSYLRFLALILFGFVFALFSQAQTGNFDKRRIVFKVPSNDKELHPWWWETGGSSHGCALDLFSRNDVPDILNENDQRNLTINTSKFYSDGQLYVGFDICEHTNRMNFEEHGYKELIISDVDHVYDPGTGITGALVKDVLPTPELFDPDFRYVSNDSFNLDRNYHVMRALPPITEGEESDLNYEKVMFQNAPDYGWHDMVKVEVIPTEETEKYLFGTNLRPRVPAQKAYQGFADDGLSHALINVPTPGTYIIRISQQTDLGQFKAQTIEIPLRVLPSPEAIKLYVNDQLVTKLDNNNYEVIIGTHRIFRNDGKNEYGPHHLLFETSGVELYDEGKSLLQLLWGYDQFYIDDAYRPKSLMEAPGISDFNTDQYADLRETENLKPVSQYDFPMVTDQIDTSDVSTKKLKLQVVQNGISSPLYNLMVTTNRDILVSVDNPTADENDILPEYYDLSGSMVGNSTEALAPGIYIVRYGTSAKKIAIR